MTRGKTSPNTMDDGFMVRRDMVYDVDEIDQMGLVFIRGTEPFCDIHMWEGEGSELLFDIPDWEYSNEDLSFRLSEFLKSMKIDFMGLCEYAELAEKFLSKGMDFELTKRMTFEKTMWLEGVGDLLEIARKSFFEFDEISSTGIAGESDCLRKFRNYDLLIGGVVRRWVMLKELESRVVKWLEKTYPEGVKSTGYLEFKVERWKACWRRLSTNQQRMLRKEYEVG